MQFTRIEEAGEWVFDWLKALKKAVTNRMHKFDTGYTFTGCNYG